MKRKSLRHRDDLQDAISIRRRTEGTLGSSNRRASTYLHGGNDEKIVVTGAFPLSQREAKVLVESIRDPENQEQIVFLHWENGNPTIFSSIKREGRIFVPPDPTSISFPDLSLPSGLSPCGNPAELLSELASTISKYVKLRPNQLLIVAAFVLASWFPDCFEGAPYLWVTGPFGSGKTQLLKVLWCLCRRGLIAGDLRSGSIYKLMDTWAPTLMIDELEMGSSRASVELLRMLRTGSVPGVPTYRNARRFSTYGLKVISSPQPPGDAALSSRGLVISMLPTEIETLPLKEAAMQELEMKFQPRLCMLRLQNHTKVSNQSVSADVLQGLSPRMKQIARVLVAPLLGDSESTSQLLAILRVDDDQARVERSLEPEWLVVEALMAVCHDRMVDGSGTEIFVGELATQVNQMLRRHGEHIRLGAKRVGLIVSSLGMNTVRLGRLGRGLKLTTALSRQVHENAAQLGIDRRAIAPSTAVAAGYGGAPCDLCEEFGVTGGLRFVEVSRAPQRSPQGTRSRFILDRPDEKKEHEAVVQRRDNEVQ